jgi:hypothetical protein
VTSTPKERRIHPKVEFDKITPAELQKADPTALVVESNQYLDSEDETFSTISSESSKRCIRERYSFKRDFPKMWPVFKSHADEMNYQLKKAKDLAVLQLAFAREYPEDTMKVDSWYGCYKKYVLSIRKKKYAFENSHFNLPIRALALSHHVMAPKEDIFKEIEELMDEACGKDREPTPPERKTRLYTLYKKEFEKSQK